MRWIEFSQRVVYETEGRLKGKVFDAGTRHQFEDDFADRWLRRGVAVVVEGPHKEIVARTRRPGAANVDIPDDWKNLKAKDLKDLADVLAEPGPANRNEALDIVEAELACRAPSLV